MASNVELFAQLIQKAGLSLAQYSIQFFTFVPDQTGYVTVLHKADGSLTRYAWHNVPKQLDIVLEREAPNGVRHVAVGMNGSYVVILNTGAMWWDGVPDLLHQLLDDALKKGRAVVVSVISLYATDEGLIDLPFNVQRSTPKTVSLSLISDSWYFIKFADGTTNFFLPPTWHDSVNKFTAQAMHLKLPKMCTSYSRSPSPSLLDRSAQQHIPFVANGFLASAFTGIPQQQTPVYNITNVYTHPMPHTQQQHTSTLQELNGMFTFLDGALKLAGTILGTTLLASTGLGGLGLGTGFGGFWFCCDTCMGFPFFCWFSRWVRPVSG